MHFVELRDKWTHRPQYDPHSSIQRQRFCVITGILLELLWWYATKGHVLVENDLPDNVIRLGTIKTVVARSTYAISIAVSFFSPKLCIIFFVAILAFYILPSRLDRYLLKASE